MAIVSPTYLFEYRVSVGEVRESDVSSGDFELAEDYRLPFLRELEAERPFADVRLGWSQAGIALTVDVTGKKHPATVDRDRPAESDWTRIWWDTRYSASVHRANRLCQSLILYPGGGGKSKTEPHAVSASIALAREPSLPIALKAVKLGLRSLKDGYHLSVWLPAEVLPGFDPENHPQLGFYYQVHDLEKGKQHFSVGEDFPFAHDPSLWVLMDLNPA
ncbi:MAG: hypothetical protein WEB58_17935 [Planctomycetaceae bacterium]